jgi:naphthalene 1,2-dioxygenase ferredoxin component
VTEPTWIDVAAVDDLFDGASIAVVVAERELALHSVDGVPFATDNLCTHGAGRLCEGFLEGHEIECPLHQGRFDVRSGAPTCAPATEAVRCYPVRIDGGRIFVAL